MDRICIQCGDSHPPAGLVIRDPTQTVASTLQQYHIVDKIEALKHDANIWIEDQFKPPKQLPEIQNPHFRGYNTEVKSLINPPVRTRYQQLQQDLKETPYASYWNAEIGKVRDPVPGLPAGMDPLQVTFGKPSEKDIPAGLLINPAKTDDEVLTESKITRELYRKSHNNYEPSEKVQRKYTESFDPDKCYGIKSKYDPRGIWAKCACDWYKKEPLELASKLQADHVVRVRPQLGKSLSPNNNASCVPENHSFGKPLKRDFYGVGELIKDPNVKPHVIKMNFRKWISALNKFKAKLKTRCRKTDFKLGDFYKKALHLDKDKTGYLEVDQFYQLCAINRVTFPKTEIESLAAHLGIIRDTKIDYGEFIKMVDFNREHFNIEFFDDIPEECKHYTTSYQAAYDDYRIIDNSGMRPAGTPSSRYDKPYPVIPDGGCRADLSHFGNETSTNTVLSPSIYTKFGLTYRDFFEPRSSDLLKNLFEKVGYQFHDDSFNVLWSAGVAEDGTGLVCVDTFKTLLDSRRLEGVEFKGNENADDLDKNCMWNKMLKNKE
ncbi:EF-hand domain-containing family member B-like [Cylas formicarius]|uniref:EF-hand domain-containing family member B-like n=1 Tax=Cylas formicarius TaxID=197179 RepID=UPI0029585618|nr:EF-hand domain-containing family member B-like [Cylas formicarius]